jgi:hypothetical protein
VQRALDGDPQAVSADRATPLDSEIDLSVLAEKVYALLKQEVSVERERLGRKWS